MVTRSLLVLADIASARYLRPAPVGVRDPVLTANGDRLRVECFSDCNGVLARLDLLASGLDGGRIGHGTTNVDIGPAMRRALARVPHGGCCTSTSAPIGCAPRHRPSLWRSAACRCPTAGCGPSATPPS